MKHKVKPFPSMPITVVKEEPPPTRRLTSIEAARVKGFADEINKRAPRKGNYDPNLGYIN